MATFPPLVERWRDLIIEENDALDPQDVDANLMWIQVESGGNTCSRGIPGVEAGIYQLFFPDDARFGATFAELAAGCGEGPGGTDAPLTDAQKRKQVTSGMAKVADCRAKARAAKERNNITWSEDTKDFWALVKLVHAGGSGYVNDFLPQIVADGGPPSTFDDLYRRMLDFDPSRITNPAIRANATSASHTGLSNRMEDILANSQRVGNAASGDFASGGGLIALLAAPLLAVFEAMTGFFRKLMGGGR